MVSFDKFYQSNLTEGRIPSIFRKATPEELATRREQYKKIAMDEWVETLMKRKDIRWDAGRKCWDVINGGNVKLMDLPFESLPVRFGKVDGFFQCNAMTELKTLDGFPSEVGGYFDLDNCPKLVDLQGCPEIVDGSFYLMNVGIGSLAGCSKTVGASFYCQYNKKLTSVEGCPTSIGSAVNCNQNPNLTSIAGFQDSVNGNFDCSNNNLTALRGSPKFVRWDFMCHENRQLTSLEGCPSEIGGLFHVWGCGRKFSLKEIGEHCKVGGDVKKSKEKLL